MNNVIAAAAKSGFVIYSIDARGLATGQPDASTPVMSDLSGRISRGTMGELKASQDVMHALANDTGGKAFFNNNNLSVSVTKGSTTHRFIICSRGDRKRTRSAIRNSAGSNLA